MTQKLILRAVTSAMCVLIGCTLLGSPVALAQTGNEDNPVFDLFDDGRVVIATERVIIDNECFDKVTTSRFEIIEDTEFVRGQFDVGEYDSREVITPQILLSSTEIIEDELTPVDCEAPPLADVPDEVLGLAITGSNVNTPVAVGAVLIGAGGLLIAAGHKRRNGIQDD